MSSTITTTVTRTEPPVLRLVLRMPMNVPEIMERLKKILEEHAGWTDDTMSQDIRGWAERTIALLPGDRGAAMDYLEARVEELRRKILFDPLDYGSLSDAQIAGPGLIVSGRVLDDWRAAAALAGEACPIVEARVHNLACSIIDWARSVCPEGEPKGSIRSVTDPHLATTKHLIYLTRARDAEVLRCERLTQKEAEARTARLLQEAAGWREEAKAIEADRARSAEESRHQMEGALQQLQGVMTAAEQFMQTEVDARRVQTANLTAQLAASQAAASSYERQIINLQRTLQGLRR